MSDFVMQFEKGWEAQLKSVLLSAEFKSLAAFLQSEQAAGQVVYPPAAQTFCAFELTPWDKVKVVILGQDPYHGPGQANGLSFSVDDGIPLPPSLKNIFKELADDVGCAVPTSGDLRSWAEQGVLLLNATLTVRAHEAGSHQKKGWEAFTDEVIRKLNQHPHPLVFILWGSFARKKAAMVNRNRHFIIESAHPSPLSSYRGFFGSKPFSQTNAKLLEWREKEIDWCAGQLSEIPSQDELF